MSDELSDLREAIKRQEINLAYVAKLLMKRKDSILIATESATFEIESVIYSVRDDGLIINVKS